eukprot:7086884-Prymnesium_polylepis.1
MSSAFTFWKAARPASQSSWLKLADTITRTRALPLATIGKTIGEAKTPSSNNRVLNALAFSSSPIITGMIGVSEWPMSNPSSVKPLR